MAYKEVHRVEISEVIRRWQAGNSQRSIATGTGLSRETVRRYLAAAQEAGVAQEGPAATADQLRRVGVGEPLGAAGAGSAQRGTAGPLVGPDLSVAHPGQAAVHQDPGVAGGAGLPNLLFLPAPVAKPAPVAATSQRQNGADGAERLWRSGRTGLWPPGLHSGPGDRSPLRGVGAAGGAGSTPGTASCGPPTARSWKRSLPAWRRPGPSSAASPNTWSSTTSPPRWPEPIPCIPRLTRGFLEYSQHRGFITDPARVRHPRDKPKVERGVQYVRERFFKGGDFKDLSHLRF